jgi:hypothetical protein
MVKSSQAISHVKTELELTLQRTISPGLLVELTALVFLDLYNQISVSGHKCQAALTPGKSPLCSFDRRLGGPQCLAKETVF